DAVEIRAEQGPQHVARREIPIEDAARASRHVVGVVVIEGGEQRAAVPEMAIEDRPGDTDARHDGVDLHRRRAAFPEEVPGRGQDRSPPVGAGQPIAPWLDDRAAYSSIP